MRNFVVLLILIAVLVLGCTNSSTNPEDDPQLINYMVLAEDHANSTRVELCVEDTVKIGYTKLFIALYDSSSNTLLNEGIVKIKPVMHMMSHSHAAPFEDIGSQQEDGFWPWSVIFIMAGEWEIEVEFTNAKRGSAGKIVLPLTVLPSQRVKKVTGSDSLSYFVCMVDPMNPQVGMNPFEITVHVKQSMMSFPAVKDLTINMEPSMPSMGHGSPNNIDPVHSENGHYQGEVNFTMTGDWRIDLILNQDSKKLAETKFDLIF